LKSEQSPTVDGQTPNCEPVYTSRRKRTALIEAARKDRYGHRDATMILIAYRHGLRARELVNLRWEQVDLRAARLHVSRVKNGTPSTHPLTGYELRSLRRVHQCCASR
jgi:type 1 fimbriae regulatory protein FimB/type 1 fimbriae regulatory protein FimE